MSLYQLTSEIPLERVEQAEGCLLLLEAVEWAVLQDVESRRALVVGTFESRAHALGSWEGVRRALCLAGISPTEAIGRELPDADWKYSYQAHFKAWKFGSLSWIPVWDRATYRPIAGEKVLWLDPGMAFGTGNHESTRLCCERLVEFEGANGCVGSVLDAGCGSGILALSAARLGFPRVCGFDNDPVAVEVSYTNARLNDLERAVAFHCADLHAGLEDVQATLVMANIQADVLTASKRILAKAVAPGGQLVLSGILARELTEVAVAFASECEGWVSESRTLGEWSDLVLRRPDQPKR